MTLKTEGTSQNKWSSGIFVPSNADPIRQDVYEGTVYVERGQDNEVQAVSAKFTRSALEKICPALKHFVAFNHGAQIPVDLELEDEEEPKIVHVKLALKHADDVEAELIHISKKKNKVGGTRLEGWVEVLPGCFGVLSIFEQAFEFSDVDENACFPVCYRVLPDKAFPFQFTKPNVKNNQLATVRFVEQLDADEQEKVSGWRLVIEVFGVCINAKVSAAQFVEMQEQLSKKRLRLAVEKDSSRELPIYCITKGPRSFFGLSKFIELTSPLRQTLTYVEEVIAVDRVYFAFQLQSPGVQILILRSEWMMLGLAAIKPGTILEAEVVNAKQDQVDPQAFINWDNYWRLKAIYTDCNPLFNINFSRKYACRVLYPWSCYESEYDFEDEQLKNMHDSDKSAAVVVVDTGEKLLPAVFVSQRALANMGVRRLEVDQVGEIVLAEEKYANTLYAMRELHIGVEIYEAKLPSADVLSLAKLEVRTLSRSNESYGEFYFVSTNQGDTPIEPYRDRKRTLPINGIKNWDEYEFIAYTRIGPETITVKSIDKIVKK